MPHETSKREGFGEAEYRAGALERLENAQVLLERGQLAGSIYMAGRGVEGMLRALIWKGDLAVQRGAAPMAVGHDIRDLLAIVRRLGVLRRGAGDTQLEADVEYVARLWSNSLRFASTKYVERRWRRMGAVRKDVTLKQAAGIFLRICADTVKRCKAAYAKDV